MKTQAITEQRNPKTTHIDKMTTHDMLKVMNDENKLVAEAVERVLDDIAVAVEAVAERMAGGGRLIYVGAGTSGRIGVIDAAECPPTFGVSQEKVVGVMAGGNGTMAHASEDAEDDPMAGAAEMERLNISADDCVIGLSASGNAAYVVAAVAEAGKRGAFTGAVTSNRECRLRDTASVTISPETGPEALTGSTRLKAGSAQKMVLNLISTGAMIKTGKVYENMMINVMPTNIKLRDRAIRILATITGQKYEEASEALDKCGSIRAAIDSCGGGSDAR